jgi:DNA-binding GntR family transcriptional regulator
MGHGARERTWTEIERRIVSGELAGGSTLNEDALAGELGVEPGVVRESLSRLERDGYVRADDDGSFAVTELNEIEVREAVPVAILLEGLAVRTTERFPDEAIARLRELNAALAEASADPLAAATLDWEFHHELVRYCGNEQLLSTLIPLKRLLLRYAFKYISAADILDRTVHQHEKIIAALERGDRDGAAAAVEENFRGALPGLLERLQR